MVPSENEAIQIRDMKDLRYAAVCHIDGLGSSRVHFIKGATCDDQDTVPVWVGQRGVFATQDRKSTRLNSSHSQISYAVFCLKKKTRPDPAPRATVSRSVRPNALSSAASFASR